MRRFAAVDARGRHFPLHELVFLSALATAASALVRYVTARQASGTRGENRNLSAGHHRLCSIFQRRRRGRRRRRRRRGPAGAARLENSALQRTDITPLQIAKLRQQLQRSKRSSRHRREKDRKSPFNGSHTLIQSQSPMPKTILIPIPISKSSAPRFRNSVEGLNQEIERIIIRDTPEKEETIVPQDVPDGHRAPPPVPPQQRSSSTRSIDTQTPSGGGLSGNHSNSSSRPDSISPSYLTVLNDTSGGSPYEDKELGPYSPLPKYAASPRPNNSYMFKREPPEGCEKVKVSEESTPKPQQEIPAFLCPDRNKVNFIPNSGSAFCLVSILKPLRPAPDLGFRPGVGLRSLSPALVPLSTQPCLLEEPESF
ncbi:hypothetical protein F2P81_002797 [Scophthalmus maximus]|uniref:Protein FAM117B n=1 Tax=Scophthalmus maximus TaxID=52904 RepID=A0A6A4TPE9_SCOMX|nr:hypothetical protein F2P81_002797 [Scophthalmus maximus]